MKTRTIVSIILTTATVVLGTIVFVKKFGKKRDLNCGCDLSGTDDCIGGVDCDCDGTEDPYCESACCYDADACLAEDESCDCVATKEEEVPTSDEEV